MSEPMPALATRAESPLLTTTSLAGGKHGGTVQTVRFLGAELMACDLSRDLAPSLYVVVDTEAEFDWSKPFARDLVRVTSIAAQERAQAIFDRHGLRPVYVVDYPVAAQPEGYLPLLRIFRRGGCEIGAHLHPWTNPPFAEEVSPANSYPGNLPPAIEAAKLDVLLEVIQRNFGLAPLFYKSGRFGLGPATLDMLVAHGIEVDFSILPGADLSANGGPDFRGLRPIPYLAAGRKVVAMPMTRGAVGPLRGIDSFLSRLLDQKVMRVGRARGALSRLGLLNRATLTPEGVSVAAQIALIQALHRQGCRAFVLSYHSPSLAPGNTPYVRDEAAVVDLLDSIETVCRYFLGPFGGRAGDPRELLPQNLLAMTHTPA